MYKEQWDCQLCVFTGLFRKNTQLRLTREELNLLILEHTAALPCWYCLNVKLRRHMCCLDPAPFAIPPVISDDMLTPDSSPTINWGTIPLVDICSSMFVELFGCCLFALTGP